MSINITGLRKQQPFRSQSGSINITHLRKTPEEIELVKADPDEQLLQILDAEPKVEGDGILTDIFGSKQTLGKKALGRGIGQGVTAWFGDELNAGAKTLLKFVTGQIDIKEDEGLFQSLVKEYKENRDFTRAVNNQLQKKHPFLYGAGELAGAFATLPALPAVAGFKGAMALGGGLGGTFALGRSERELTDPRLGLDVLKGAAIGSALGGLGKGLKFLSKGFQKRPTNANILNRIAGGDNVAAQSKFFARARDGSQKFVDSIKTAKRFGVVKEVELGVRQPILEQGKSVVKKQLDKASDFFTRGRNLDHRVLQKQTTGILDDLGQQIDDIVARAQSSLRKTYDITTIIGPSKGKALDLIRRLNSAKTNLALNPNFGKEAQALDAVAKAIKANPKFDLKGLVNLKRQLGKIARFDKELAPGPAKDLVDDFFRLDKFIQKEIDSAGVKSFFTSGLTEATKKLPRAQDTLGNISRYKNLESDFSSMSHFKDLVNAGQPISSKFAAANPRFRESAFVELTETLPGLTGVGTKSGFGKLLGTIIDVPLRAVLAATGSIFKLPMNAWLGSLFSSWGGGKIRSNKDKELFKHYIENNPKLNALQKAKHINNLNTTGVIDPKIIPPEIKSKAIELQAATQEQSNNIQPPDMDLGFPLLN